MEHGPGPTGQEHVDRPASPTSPAAMVIVDQVVNSVRLGELAACITTAGQTFDCDTLHPSTAWVCTAARASVDSRGALGEPPRVASSPRAILALSSTLPPTPTPPSRATVGLTWGSHPESRHIRIIRFGRGPRMYQRVEIRTIYCNKTSN